MSLREIDEQVMNIWTRKRRCIPDWNPYVNASVCDVPHRGLRNSGTLTVNSTAIREVFAYVANVLSSNRINLNHYIDEGMDEVEFTEAEETLESLVAQYEEA